MIPETILIVPPKSDLLVAYGIGGIAVVVAVVWMVLFSFGKGRRAAVLSAIAIAVMGISAFAALSGILSRFNSFPPPMLVMIISVPAMAFAFGFSPFGSYAVEEQSLAALVGLQAYRFPLELVMHHASTVGIMPVELSYSGYNFDIVTGVGAMAIFVLLKSGRGISGALFVWLQFWSSQQLLHQS